MQTWVCFSVILYTNDPFFCVILSLKTGQFNQICLKIHIFEGKPWSKPNINTHGFRLYLTIFTCYVLGISIYFDFYKDLYLYISWG